MAELLLSFPFSEKNSEEPSARTSHPLLQVDETEVKDKGKESSEVPASRDKDGGSRDSKLPSAPPDTSKC